ACKPLGFARHQAAPKGYLMAGLILQGAAPAGRQSRTRGALDGLGFLSAWALSSVGASAARESAADLAERGKRGGLIIFFVQFSASLRSAWLLLITKLQFVC